MPVCGRSEWLCALTMPHSQPARVSTSASARTVPAGCGSDDQDGGAVGMVSGWHAGDVDSVRRGIGGRPKQPDHHLRSGATHGGRSVHRLAELFYQWCLNPGFCVVLKILQKLIWSRPRNFRQFTRSDKSRQQMKVGRNWREIWPVATVCGRRSTLGRTGAEFAKMIGADREQVQTNHSWAVAS